MARAKTNKSDKNDAGKQAKKLAKGTQSHLVLLCDESGSMIPNVESVVNGVNEFKHEFSDKDVRITLAMFDHHPGEDRTRIKWNDKKVNSCKDLTASDYKPRGLTPLYDAIIDVIDSLDNKLSNDETALVIILTDGLENRSEHSEEDVKKLIKKREKQGWKFLYLGANQEATKVAAGIGLSGKGQSFNFTSSPVGTKSVLRSATHLAGTYTQDPSQYEVQAQAMAKATGSTIAEEENKNEGKS